MLKVEHLNYEEYYKIINKKEKFHENAYQNNELSSYSSPEDFPKTVNRFISYGMKFEIREKKKDLRLNNYYKVDDNGDPLRDENKELVYLTMEEKEKLFPEEKRYKYEHAIFDVKKKCIVAETQDEWGCLLITVANEYRGLNIGQKLLNYHRTIYPYRDSGGHTIQGANAFFAFYQEKVSKYLSSGNYRKDIDNGLITIEKVKEILDSAHLTKEVIKNRKEDFKKYNLEYESFHERVQKNKKNSSSINYDFTDPRDFALHIDDSCFAILYNKKAFEMLNTKNEKDFFTDQGLLGYVYIGGVYNADAIPKLFRLHGINDKVKSFMIDLALHMSYKEPIRIFAEDLPYLSEKSKGNIHSKMLENGMMQVTLESKYMENLDFMHQYNLQYRKRVDPYEEKFNIMHERLTAMTDVEIDPENKIRRQRKTKYYR